MNSEGEAPEAQSAQEDSATAGDAEIAEKRGDSRELEGPAVVDSGVSSGAFDNVDKDFVSGMIAIGIALVIIVAAIISAAMTPAGDSEGKASEPQGAEVAGALSDASSSGTASVPGASGASSSAPVAPSALYDDAKYRDGRRNPSLYAILELTGAELQNLLAEYGFQWDSPISFWASADGSLFGVEDASGLLGRAQIDAFPAGAAGQPVIFCLSVTGYDTPAEAFDVLSADVEVDGTRSGDDALFAVVHGASADKCLLVATTTDEGEQTFLVFTGEAIASGLFTSVVGIDAGSSIEEVWKALA